MKNREEFPEQEGDVSHISAHEHALTANRLPGFLQ